MSIKSTSDRVYFPTMPMIGLSFSLILCVATVFIPRPVPEIKILAQIIYYSQIVAGVTGLVVVVIMLSTFLRWAYATHRAKKARVS